jgi:hypothetical protein
LVAGGNGVLTGCGVCAGACCMGDAGALVISDCWGALEQPPRPASGSAQMTGTQILDDIDIVSPPGPYNEG